VRSSPSYHCTLEERWGVTKNRIQVVSSPAYLGIKGDADAHDQDTENVKEIVTCQRPVLLELHG